jgi:TonB family protein
MESVIYLLKVNAAIAVFYLVYRLCYRRDTFFSLRRYLLLGMFCIPVIYPFLDFSQWFMRHATLTEAAVTYMHYLPELNIVSSRPAGQIHSFGDCALWCYAAVAGVLFVRLCVRLFRIVRFRWRCTPARIENHPVYCLQTKAAPFSFFNWIFICPEMHRPAEIREIMAHELVHVRQHHSLDVLLSEIVCACCWMNPLAWMLKNEIRRNLEFLVDSRVIKGGVNVKSYQYHLLQLACRPSQITISNQFNISPLKERIMMLNTKQSPKVKLVAYTLLLPLAFLFLVANNAGAVVDRLSGLVAPKNSTSAYIQENEFEIGGLLADADNGQPIPGANIIVQGTNRGTLSGSDGRFTLKVSEGECLLFFHSGYTGITYPVQTTQGDLGKIRMKRNKKTPDEVVVIGYGTMPADKSTPANSDVFVVVEQMPEFPGGMEAMMQFLGENIRYPQSAQQNGIQGRVVCSFVIDSSGVITDARIEKGVDPALDREALRVVYSMPAWKPGKQRGKAVAVAYTIPVNFRLQGESAAPKMEEITVTNFAPRFPNDIFYLKDRDKMPVFYLDNVETPYSSIQTLNAHCIESITILKDQTATGLYGKVGENGAILITTKAAEKRKAIETDSIR